MWDKICNFAATTKTNHRMMRQRWIFLTLMLMAFTLVTTAQDKPRVLVSTDIGGTDPDDNQSMIHLLMYSDLFELEGLVSSMSFGNGSKEEIVRMIDLYAKDYPQLKKRNAALMSPDAPDIVPKIRVYYIGGPNKKWGANSYAYIARNFPDLWIIENNATYRGFITDNDKMELIEEYRSAEGRLQGKKGMEQTSNRYGTGYYNYAMWGRGAMGADFLNYYKGVVKMGDTPSLLYMMHGDSNDPQGESWGGSFEPIRHSSRRIFHRQTTEQDTVPVYSVVEWFFKGPKKKAIHEGDSCFTATIDKQQWTGYYLGKGVYVLRYSPKAPAKLTYKLSSAIRRLDGLQGSFVVNDVWPGKPHADDYQLGANWYSDRNDRTLYEGKWQGAKTQRKWRKDILEDWARRWYWLED